MTTNVGLYYNKKFKKKKSLKILMYNVDNDDGGAIYKTLFDKL